jgi:hypothetical protein
MASLRTCRLNSHRLHPSLNSVCQIFGPPASRILPSRKLCPGVMPRNRLNRRVTNNQPPMQWKPENTGYGLGGGPVDAGLLGLERKQQLALRRVVKAELPTFAQGGVGLLVDFEILVLHHVPVVRMLLAIDASHAEPFLVFPAG